MSFAGKTCDQESFLVSSKMIPICGASLDNLSTAINCPDEGVASSRSCGVLNLSGPHTTHMTRNLRLEWTTENTESGGGGTGGVMKPSSAEAISMCICISKTYARERRHLLTERMGGDD